MGKFRPSWGGGGGGTCVPRLTFKTCRFAYRRGNYVAVGMFYYYICAFLLSQFQPIFVSFVAISTVLCHYFKAILLVGILP